MMRGVEVLYSTLADVLTRKERHITLLSYFTGFFHLTSANNLQDYILKFIFLKLN